jgi:hypothetical protein
MFPESEKFIFTFLISMALKARREITPDLLFDY